MRKHMILTAIAGLALGGQALAEGLSYSYVQADVVGSKLKGFGDSVSGNGFGVEASGAIGSNMLILASVGTTKYSESGTSLRFTPVSLGAGAHATLGSSVDFVGSASFERTKLKFSGAGSDSFSGWGLAAGLRGQASGKFDWDAGLKYRHLKDIKSVIGFTIGGQYNFTPNFALGLDLTSLKYDKDVLDVKENMATLGFRFNIGS